MNFDNALSRLREIREPWWSLFVGERASAYEMAWKLAQAGMVTRVIRGAKMGSLDSLFDEFGAALQFPDYFGENWPALDECLRDLSWMQGAGYTLVVVDALHLLEREDARQFGVLLRILKKAALEWARPAQPWSTWDRDGIPFHVVFQVGAQEQESLRARFLAVGEDISEMPA